MIYHLWKGTCCVQDLLSVARICDSNLSQVLVLHYIAPL